jgi:hypothetical protein
MKTVVAHGETLVEILATRRGRSFGEPGGPYPGGAPTIPETLIAKDLPAAYPAVRNGALEPAPLGLVLHAIRQACASDDVAASATALISSGEGSPS